MLKSKKLVSMLLAVVMMLSLGSVGVFAEETTTTTTAIITNDDVTQETVEVSVNIPDNASEDDIYNILFDAAKEIAGIEADSAPAGIMPAYLPSGGVKLCNYSTILSNNYPNYSQTQLGGFSLNNNVSKLGIGLTGISDINAKINLRLHNTAYSNNNNDPYILNQSVSLPDYDCLFTFFSGVQYPSGGATASFPAGSSFLVYASVEGSPCTINAAYAYTNF